MRGSCWRPLKRVGEVSFVLLALLIAVHGQVKVGENLTMTGTGEAGGGYSGNYGDFESSHGIYATGQAQVSGNYYSPNFLNFTVQPFYNRNQENSTFGSVLTDSGITTSANLFSGTRFPGSVSYGYRKEDGSSYGLVPGAGLASNANSNEFAISWSELLPKYPSLTFTFANSSTTNDIPGEEGTINSSMRSFNVLSAYTINGFNISGWYIHQNNYYSMPFFLSPVSYQNDGSNNVLGVVANHRMFWSGDYQFGYNWNNYNYRSDGFTSSGSTSSFDASTNMRPTQKFTLGAQARYTTNLLGSLQQNIVAGGAPIFVTNGQSSDGTVLNEYATYDIGHGFMLTGFGNSQFQHFGGQSYSSNQFGGTLNYNYSRPLLGMLYFSFGMSNTGSTSVQNIDSGLPTIPNSTNSTGQNGLGFVGSVGLKRNIRGWDVNLDFIYSQNVQSVIASYTTSNLSYGGFVRKRYGANTYLNASYRGIQNGMTQFAGYSNRADNFLVVLTRGRWGVSGNYSKYTGSSLLSFNGNLQPSPLIPFIPDNQVLYNGTTYGFGVNVAPLRRLIILANWYRTRADTTSAVQFSHNNSDRIYSQAQYNVRQLQFTAGYYRTYQLISSSALPSSTSNTYYFTVTRWFSLF
jgi:hypothetical protein